MRIVFKFNLDLKVKQKSPAIVDWIGQNSFGSKKEKKDLSIILYNVQLTVELFPFSLRYVPTNKVHLLHFPTID